MSVNTQRLHPVSASVLGASRVHSHRRHPLTALLRRLLDRLVLAHKRRAAINELSRLSDRQLNDIGIQRGLISQAVVGALRREQDSRRAGAARHS